MQTVDVRPTYVTYEAAMRYTGLSRVTLWKATKAGELRVSKVGTAARFKLADLDAFMASKAA